MKSITWRALAVGLSILGYLAVAANADNPKRLPEKLIVHEWGTFLSVQGSDGVTLGGMIESEEKLPIFVRERSLGGSNRACFNQKMETPVTYFYVDHPQKVQVRVDMPQGILSHWFPAVRGFGSVACRSADPNSLGSYLDWGQVELIPDTRLQNAKLAVPPAYRPVGPVETWRFARETDAAFVKTTPGAPRTRPEGDMEKFLFYRGVGSFDLPLQIKFGPKSAGEFTVQNTGAAPLGDIIAIQVQGDSIQFAVLGELPGHSGRGFSNDKPLLTGAMPLKDGVTPAKQAVAAALVKQGLYLKEAQAMVNTWEKSYFRTDGLRILYLIPREVVDATIPIRISPAPEELVRVMVGRIEVLTPRAEKRLEHVVGNLTSADPTARQAAEAEFAHLGRLKEPILRRIQATSHDPVVLAQAKAQLEATQHKQ